jgi:FKBP12-rapamycin complex-associated protein
MAVEMEAGKGLEGWDHEEEFKNSIALTDPDIRYCVLASLDERFDAHLAQAENLQALFVALNDQVFEIRELAICTVGRLSSMNPAFVMPFLRKMLIQVMGDSQTYRQ